MTAVAEPPLRLPLGADTLQAFDAKLDTFRKEMDTWRHVALSTDHDQDNTAEGPPDQPSAGLPAAVVSDRI
ncbi:hypothetical protein SAZ11_01365 [Streptomyces sp. FXJ1.4098]|uniref:hypothetical protein n=1 Tax=Streptomyces sp. NPDC020845 TaxID=3365096 RepID=UPI002995F0B6|nr:hypothetical protein [Streptomyces sp. FXJ1.4098]